MDSLRFNGCSCTFENLQLLFCKHRKLLECLLKLYWLQLIAQIDCSCEKVSCGLKEISCCNWTNAVSKTQDMIEKS